MGDLTQKVIRGIEAANIFDDIGDWIWIAGDLIRKAAQTDYPSGFEEIDRETVTWGERVQLKEAALRALKRNPDPVWVGSMLSVLRMTGDRDLMQLWIDSLAENLRVLKMANANVFAALLALREIDEPVFEDDPSVCSLDVDRNVEEAQKVLDRRGIQIPW